MADLDVKPLRADARRNRERVVAAARELFAKQGRDAQIDDIAAQAGVGVGTVYRHFPTKEALLTEMVRRRFAAFEVIAAEASGIEDAYEALATVMRRSAAEVEGDAAFQLAMLGPDQLEWEGIENDKARLTELVAAIIARGAADGSLRSDLTFEDFPMLMCSLTAVMYFKPGPAPWERQLEVVLAGIRGARSRP